MIRSRSQIQKPLCVLLLSLTFWSGPLTAGAAEPSDRRSTIAQFNALMREDRRAEALPLCRQYTLDHPDDPAMLYNLACLENTIGNPERAIAAFRAALAAGFSDLDLAAADPDLQGDIRGTIRELSAAEQERLAALSRQQGLSLILDAWSAPRSLLLAPGTQPDVAAVVSEPQLRLRWHDATLEFELTAAKGWQEVATQATRSPWHGGHGLILSLCIPDGTSSWESANHYLFAFGLEAKGGLGGMYMAAQGHWQPVLELAPKIKSDDSGRVVMTGAIPWPMLMPFNPVVDTPLGLNATLVVNEAGKLRRASLVQTNDTLQPKATRRRFAPLDFQTDSITKDLFLGKLSTSLSSDQPLDVDLVAVSTIAGEATLSLNFIDQAGRSVLPDGPLRGKIDLQQGTNRITRQADFSSLTTGGYIIQAELTFPSGHQKSWGATVLQMTADWLSQYEDRIAYVAREEQATVRHLIDTVAGAVAGHQPRRNPSAIVATLLDLEQMLNDAEESGSILPSKGSFVMVYPGPDEQQRICRMYLPAGRDVAKGLNPILALGPDPKQASRLADRIGRNYEYGKQLPTLKTGNDDRFPIYLVPEIPSDPADLQASLLAEADACRRWAMATFGAGAVSLAGVDALGGTSLLLARHAPTQLRGLLIFAGQGLNPWPQAQPEFIRQQLAPAPADLPITWIDFATETDRAGQARQILQALKDLGFQISDEQEVRGSLNLTQVADRLVLWAESLR